MGTAVLSFIEVLSGELPLEKSHKTDEPNQFSVFERKKGEHLGFVFGKGMSAKICLGNYVK